METRRAIRMLRVAKQRRQAAGVAGRKRGAENEGAEVAPDELTLEVRAGVRDEVSFSHIFSTISSSTYGWTGCR